MRDSTRPCPNSVPCTMSHVRGLRQTAFMTLCTHHYHHSQSFPQCPDLSSNCMQLQTVVVAVPSLQRKDGWSVRKLAAATFTILTTIHHYHARRMYHTQDIVNSALLQCISRPFTAWLFKLLLLCCDTATTYRTGCLCAGMYGHALLAL